MYLPSSRTIDRILNAAIVVAVIVLLFSLGRLYKSESAGHPGKNIVGTKVSLAGIDFSKSLQTLLLFIKYDCTACQSSAPFYQRLRNSIQDQSRVRFVAVVPYKHEGSATYPIEEDSLFDEVLRAKTGTLGVRAAPTLILVDSSGTVKGAWIGELTAVGEAEVLQSLQY